MSQYGEPPRLTDRAAGAPEELRQLLVQAREDVPSRSQLTRLAAALSPLAVPAGTAASSAATAASVAKLVGVVLVGGAVVGGGVWLAGFTEPQAPGQPSGIERPAPPPKPKPATKVTPAPVQTSAAKPEASSDRAAAPPRPPATVQARSSGPSEAQLLASAQAALRKSPARALALCKEHRRRFPQGALAQEREVIAIEALSRLGREQEARGRADQFDKRYPGSAHRRKVGSSVSGE